MAQTELSLNCQVAAIPSTRGAVVTRNPGTRLWPSLTPVTQTPRELIYFLNCKVVTRRQDCLDRFELKDDSQQSAVSKAC